VYPSRQAFCARACANHDFPIPVGPVNRAERCCATHCEVIDWRHFSASVLLGQGVPDNVIAKHTGHKRKELERYKHLFPELRQQTVQLIDKEVKIPKKKT